MHELPGMIVRKLILRISLRAVLIIGVLLILTLVVPPLLDLFLPFVLAFVFASILTPMVRRVSRKMGSAWNFWSIFFILIMILAICGILGYMGYYLYQQISDLITSWPDLQLMITGTLNKISEFLDSDFHLTSSELEGYFIDLLQKLVSWITEKISSWAPTVVSGVGSIASGIASFVISFLFFVVGTYFMTADYPALTKTLRGWVPDIIRPHMAHIREVMNSAMFGYLKAQLILSSVIALVIFIALLFWGQSYSILIAIVCGIVDIIPFFGSGTVIIPWAVVSLLWGDYKKALFLLILCFILFLFRKLAEPKIVGNQTGLNPLLSLMSIYVGMKLGGVLGMILCPIVCMVIIGLYNVGFFDPTINDFKMLGKHIIASATLRPPSNDET